MEFVLTPSIIPNGADWTLLDFSGVQQSPTSGAIRTISRGQRWQAHVMWNDLIGNDRQYMLSLMALLRGKSNRVWIKDATYKQQGTFPAPELAANNYFNPDVSSWVATGQGAISGFNRTAFLTATGNTNASAFVQNVAMTSGIAYALRACIIDGPATSAITCGLRFIDPSSNVISSIALARGLLTASAVSASSGTGQVEPIYMSTAPIGTFLLGSYSSFRRCALASNPSALTYYTTLPVTHLPVSTAGLLRAGDRFEVNNEMKVATFDLNSDSSGNGILMFEPALRAVVPDNSAIHIGEPMMRGILANNAMQVTRPGTFSDFDFTFIEA